MSKRRYIQNLRSQTTIDNNGVKIPKLPEANYIKEGEIAINFATGYETIAIKNADGEIVKFDNKVDENYEQTHYTDRFDDLVDNNVVTNNDGDHLNTHIKGGDNISFAFKKTEGTINKLVEEIYDNEEITAKSIGTLGIATGVINDKGLIGYQKENDSNYIAGANSIHEATMMLDDEVSTIDSKAMNIATATGVINDQDVIGYQKETGVHYIKDATSVHDATVKLDIRLKQTTDTSNKNFQNIEYLANVAGAVKNVEGTYIYQADNNTKYIAGAHSVHEATVLLDNELSKQDDTDSDIAKAIGLTKTGTKYVYKVNTNSNYIGSVNSVDEATIALDSQIRNNENSIIDVQRELSDYDERFNIIYKVISKFPSIEYVDLGLPSGTLWLTCNLGATTPTDIGHYYMWGSLSPNDKTDCNWSNTPFNDSQTTQNDTVFNTATAGSKNIVLYQNRLNEAFDVIYHRTHGIAKLPTEEQINELISDNNTTRAWVTNYQGTTVKGFTFTSKRNNNVLFIPAGGFRKGTSTNQKGKTMYVMSSNIDSSHKIITLRGYNSGLNGSSITMPGNNTLERNQAIPLRGVIV